MEDLWLETGAPEHYKHKAFDFWVYLADARYCRLQTNVLIVCFFLVGCQLVCRYVLLYNNLSPIWDLQRTLFSVRSCSNLWFMITGDFPEVAVNTDPW